MYIYICIYICKYLYMCFCVFVCVRSGGRVCFALMRRFKEAAIDLFLYALVTGLVLYSK